MIKVVDNFVEIKILSVGLMDAFYLNFELDWKFSVYGCLKKLCIILFLSFISKRKREIYIENLYICKFSIYIKKI